MPTCASRSGSELGRDDRAVSEVVGYLLVFGILSMVLVLSMLAFSVIQQRAEASVVQVEAESVAQRVASAAVNAALFVETYYNDSANTSYAPGYLHPLQLPLDLEGHAYRVVLSTVEVEVHVDGLNLNVTSPLFSAGAAPQVSFCSDSNGVSGGPVAIRFDTADGTCIQLLEA